jgi:hypothetical protein
MKSVLGALALAVLAVGLFASSPAQAQCWWNGNRTVCNYRPYPYAWTRYPGWRHDRWCYYHARRCP